MITQTVVQAHARGVAGVLADAGLREKLSVARSGSAVNVHFRDRVSDRVEARRLGRVVALLEEAGYEAHVSVVVPWLVRVTGKRKNVRSSS